MKVAVAGTGYVGLVTAVCLAEIGHDVICVDTIKEKIEMLNSGKSPIYEQGLEELMQKNKDRLEYTLDGKSAYKNADVIFIGVGTPSKKDGSADLSYITNVAKEIADSAEKNSIVVIKSTVPLGTNEKIEEILKKNAKNNVNFEVISNPEFLAQGEAVKDTLHPSRIVLGVQTKNAENIMRELYKGIDTNIVVTNRVSAELIKYASNSFLALKISYINEIANVCDIVGANVEDVAYGMGLDPRISEKFLRAGIGYGGSCFSKDTKALKAFASLNNYELKIIRAAIEVNYEQRLKLIKKARTKIKSFDELNVAILGLTFKPNTDDLRDAPSIENIEFLLEEGANITAYDPIGEENYKKIFPSEIKYALTPEEALKNADICFVFTEWDEIKAISPETFKECMKIPLVYDGRNIYDIQKMKDAGIEYYNIGRN